MKTQSFLSRSLSISLISIVIVLSFVAIYTPLWAATPTCTVKAAADQLNVRKSPGVSGVRIAQLRSGDKFQPLTIVDLPNDTQNPRWVQLKLKDGRLGWVSARTQFLSCTINLSTLPKGTAPIPPTPTPFAVAFTDLPAGGGGDEILNGVVRGIGAKVDGDNNIVFRKRMEVRLEATYNGKSKGQGIESVEYFVSDEEGNTVHQQTERNYPYCMFGNNTNDCENVWVFANTGFTWPQSQIEIDPDTTYFMNITATSTNGESRNWNFSFKIER